MNLKNILMVRNTGNILPKATVVENLFGMNLGGGGSERNLIAHWDFKQSFTDLKNGVVASTQFITRTDADGVQIRTDESFVKLPGMLSTNRKIVLKIGAMRDYVASNQHGRILTYGDTANSGFIWRSTRNFGFWSSGSSWMMTEIGDHAEYFSNSELTIIVDSEKYWSVYKDGVFLYKTPSPLTMGSGSLDLYIGAITYSYHSMWVESAKIYDLSEG